MNFGKELLSDFKFKSGYAKYNPTTESYETWEEAVDRVIGMHKMFFKEKLNVLNPYFDELEKGYKNKLFLGSQRVLQFGLLDEKKGILGKHAKLYNCLTSYADRPQFFQEAMWWLLNGCGVGFRVFHDRDVSNYENIEERNKGVKTFVISDDIEGWSDAIGVLISSYLSSNNKKCDEITFKDYQGYRIDFDYSLIRPKGAYISGGFKAPGSEGLRSSILKIENLIESRLKDNKKLRTIDVYDIIMHCSDAVLSGGVRRSATIVLFDKNDELMLKAKTGDWYITQKQRGRSNNSILLLKNSTSKEEFDKIFESVKEWGEPGFVWTDDFDNIYNPCVEIGMFPKTIDNRSGWQACNLVEINGSKCKTADDFYKACRLASIMGTLQASYTNFDYVDRTSPAKEIVSKEALLGVSITGFTMNPDVLFNPEILSNGAKIVKDVNLEIAKLININPAARTTCVKPSGSASALLCTSSGIHGEHSKRYFRNVQVNKNEDIAKFIKSINPNMFEESVWSANNTDLVMSIPVDNEGTILYKDSLLGINLLEKVKLVQQYWVEPGTNYELCLNSTTRHNVSNTVNINNNWEEVRDYIYSNRKWFAGISLLSNTGDKDYAQAPFTSVLTEQEILNKYGVSSMFASGLIIDGLHAFNNDLWNACYTVLFNIPLNDDSDSVLKKDWVRRFIKFAKNYFEGDLIKTSYLLKDVYLLHKWEKITKSLKPLDWNNLKVKPEYTDVSTLGAIACSGNSCEI